MIRTYQTRYHANAIRPFNLNAVVKTSVCLAVLSMILTGCEKLESYESQEAYVDVGVEIQQTQPLVAGSSVGSANIQVISTEPDPAPVEAVVVESKELSVADVEPVEKEGVVVEEDTAQKPMIAMQSQPDAGKQGRQTEPKVDPALMIRQDRNSPLIAAIKGEKAPAVSSKSATSTTSPASKRSQTIVISNVGPINKGTPEATVRLMVDTLYFGDAKKVVPYYHSELPDLEAQIIATQPGFQRDVERVTIDKVIYNEDKTQAKVMGTIKMTNSKDLRGAQYSLQKIDGSWRILG